MPRDGIGVVSIVSPPGFGRPDYSASSPNLRQLVAYINQDVPVVYDTPLVSTAAWRGLEILWVPTGIASFVEAAWYDDANQGNLLGTAPLYSTEGNQVIGPVAFENIGPHVQVQLQHYPVTGVDSKDQMWVYLVADPFRLSTPFMGDYAANNDNFTVTAGSSFTYTSSSLMAGPARLWISSTGALTWELQRASGYGGYITIDGSLASGTVFRESILLPASEWRMIITNTVASDANFSLYIQPSITGAT